MGDGGDDMEAQRAPEGRGEPARGDHAKGSVRIPTIPPVDEVIELDDTIRKTEKMSASHFRSMLGPTAMLSHLPPIPPPAGDTVAPPIEHEDVVSSKLMEAALAQIKSGARIRLKSETDAADLELDDDARPVRSGPTTLPISNKRLNEITATADNRPAIAMPPLTRPAEGTPGIGDLPKIPAERRMQRMPRIRPESEVVKPPRIDGWVLFATGLLMVALFATVALLITR